MGKRTGTIIAICIMALGYSGCLKHTPRVASEQKGTPAGQASFPEYVHSVLKISSENNSSNDEALAALHKRRPELADLAQHLAGNPKDADAIGQLGEAYLQEKHYLKAYELFQQLQILAPEDPKSSMGLARIWEAWGDSGLGVEYASRAVAQAPKSAEALAIQGRLHLRRKEYDAALTSFLAALRLSPDSGPLRANAGYVYVIRGEWEKALQHLQRAVEIDGSVAETRNHLGVVLVRLGDADGALRQFMAANEPAAAHNNLGAAYLAINDWKRAQDEFRVALSIDPGYSMAARNLEEAESHLPPPVVDITRALPGREAGIAQADWKRPVEAGQPQYHPIAAVTLSEYIRKVFHLQDVTAGGDELAQIPSNETNRFNLALGRYRLIPGYTMGTSVLHGSQARSEQILPVSLSQSTGQALGARENGVTRRAPLQVQFSSKEIVLTGPSLSHYRQIGAYKTSPPALAAAQPQFHAKAPISLSDYIRRVFRLQELASGGDGTAQGSFRAADPASSRRHGSKGTRMPAGRPSFPGAFERERQIAANTTGAAGVKLLPSTEPVFSSAMIVPFYQESAPLKAQITMQSDERFQTSQSKVAVLPQEPAVHDPWVLVRVGQRLLEQRQWEQARRNLERALELNQAIPEARNNLGLALAQLGDREGALRHFMTVSSPAEAFHHLGLIYLSQRKLRDARREFQLALRADPGFSPARARLGEVSARLSPSAAYSVQVFAARKGNSAGLAGDIQMKGAALDQAGERENLEERGIWYRSRIDGHELISSALQTAKRFLLAGLVRESWAMPFVGTDASGSTEQEVD